MAGRLSPCERAGMKAVKLLDYVSRTVEDAGGVAAGRSAGGVLRPNVTEGRQDPQQSMLRKCLDLFS